MIEVLVVAFVVVVLLGILLPLVQQAREAALFSDCIGGNTKQFMLALHNYHDVYSSFPPAYVSGATKERDHSWRTLTFPYLDNAAEYAAYNFAQPWSAAANRAVFDGLGDRPYKCPKSPPENQWMTDFLAITGPNAAWADDGSVVRIRDMTDGTSQTIMFAEVHTSEVHRAEPKDFHIDRVVIEVNSDRTKGISSRHPGIAFVAFADGSISAVGKRIDRKVLRALLTRNGNEQLPVLHRQNYEIY